MIIAITGCIGSGKTFYLNKINELYHFDIYSCDDMTRQAYQDKNIMEQLNKYFNCLVDNKIDKSIIKSNLNDRTIDILNSIIHPYIQKQILIIKEKYQNSYAFIEVPLLFETNMDVLFDKSIAISVFKPLRHKRLKNRSNNAYLDMLKLEKRQFSNFKKASLASYVLHSGKNDTKNLKQLRKIMNDILKEGE